MHKHEYGFQYGSYYGALSFSKNSMAGLLDYTDSSNYTVIQGYDIGDFEAPLSTPVSTSFTTLATTHFRIIAKISTASTLSPDITVYMWKRTA